MIFTLAVQSTSVYGAVLDVWVHAGKFPFLDLKINIIIILISKAKIKNNFQSCMFYDFIYLNFSYSNPKI